MKIDGPLFVPKFLLLNLGKATEAVLVIFPCG